MDLGKSLKMVQLEINDLDWLYQSYMPFVSTGGIYFSSAEEFEMGEGVLLVLTIRIDGIDKKYPIRTEVIWKQPRSGQKGYGVSFGEDEVGVMAKKMVENLLEKNLKSEQKTFTM
ncbi:MAG: PilZ domain-containing protein [Neisseriaceae bacterium]